MQETVARVPAPETILQVAMSRSERAAPGTAPAGLIFHVARCGSTLISQSLKTLDNLVVYAEPQPVNEILAPPHTWPRVDLVAALRALGAAFARHARGPYVLKLSSWNTLFCDLVTEAFPDTPWVLSLRDPVEVGVSLVARPPGWFGDTTEASRGLAALVAPGGASRSPEEFAARVYGAFCAAAARLDVSRGRLARYESLPAAVWDIVAPHFSLSMDAARRDAVIQAARAHAKSPVGRSSEFVPDSAAKQAAASDELRRAIDSFARPQLDAPGQASRALSIGARKDARDVALGARQPFQPEHAAADLDSMIAPRVGQDPGSDRRPVFVLRGLRVTREHG